MLLGRRWLLSVRISIDRRLRALGSVYLHRWVDILIHLVHVLAKVSSRLCFVEVERLSHGGGL